MTEELQKKLALVKAAIERVKTAEARYREVNTDPTAGSDDRAGAWDHWVAAEREFGWQCCNVKELLEAWERGEKLEVTGE